MSQERWSNTSAQILSYIVPMYPMNQEGLSQEQGLEQGRLQEQRLVIENLLKARFDEIDFELASIIPSLLTLPTEEYTVLLLKPRSELLAHFNQ